MNLSKFIKSGESRLYHPKKSIEFNYSDGKDTEQGILETLKSCKDLSSFSSELSEKIKDWPTEYHFSPARHNLLRHIHFGPEMTILEIGCGCGAITRQLGESGAQVHSIEGSILRASCAAERCRDLENVKVFCTNFDDVSLDGVYDVVLLIGVLEYANLYFGSIRNCLVSARNALNESGVLIVAIENQLGLKYFSGFGEDHTAKPYFGIEDRYSERGIQTFGRKDILNRLNDAKFDHVTFQYPFPDYKIPQIVLTEAAIQAPNFQVSDLLSSAKARDYSGKLISGIRDKYVFPVLERNHMIQDLSNSFLIFASQSKHSDFICDSKKELAYKYTTNRRKSLCTQTTFRVEDECKISVRKRRILGLQQSHKAVMQYQDTDSEYIVGQNLALAIDFSMHKGDLSRASELLHIWLDFLKQASPSSKAEGNWQNSLLDSALIDATPRNFQLAGHQIHLIDKEWRFEGKFTPKFLWCKYLLEKLLIDRDWNLELVFASKTISIENFSAEFGLDLTEADLKEFLNVQKQINEDVFEVYREYGITLRKVNQLLSSQNLILKKAQRHPYYRWQENPLDGIKDYLDSYLSVRAMIKRKAKSFLKRVS